MLPRILLISTLSLLLTRTTTVHAQDEQQEEENTLFTNPNVPTPQSTSRPPFSTQYAVIITYSRCTETINSTVFAIPPITKTVPVYSSAPWDDNFTPITTYTTQATVLDPPSQTTYPVAIVQPTDVDPVELAFQSHAYNPDQCIFATATTPVDYRGACETGAVSRAFLFASNESSFLNTCGDLNPCCYDCTEYEKIPCDAAPCFHADCSDGYGYQPGDEPSPRDSYTVSAPDHIWGNWTEEQWEKEGYGVPLPNAAERVGFGRGRSGGLGLSYFIVFLLGWLSYLR